MEAATLEAPPETQATETTAEASPDEPREKREKPDALEMPACLLRVVGVSAKEDGRYSMTGVLIDVDSEESTVCAVSTDGRRLIMARSNRGIFDETLNVIVPGQVARNASRIASVRPQRDEQAVITIERRPKKHWRLTAYTTDGPVDFTWKEDPEQKFPPYRDVIPDYTDSNGIALIGLTPDLVATTLHTLQRVVGKDPKVKVFLPPQPDRPLKLESNDGDTIHACAVIMPTVIEGWQPEKKPETPAAEGVKDVAGQQMLPMDDESWRSVKLSDLAPAIKSSKLKILAEHSKPITTLGELVDYQAKGEWWWKDLKGFGSSGVEQIAAACERYWADHPRKAVESKVEPTADDSGMKASTVAVASELATLLKIEIGQRESGPWAYRLRCSFGAKVLEKDWTGTFETSAKAAVAAADLVDENLPAHSKLKKSMRENVKAIRGALQLLDEQITAQTGKSIDDVRDLPPATVDSSKDASGNPKRFKGNKKAK